MNGYDPDIVHRVHNELMEDINQRDIMIAELKSQTQELIEQNRELISMLEKCQSLMKNSIFTPHHNTALAITELLTKYQKP